MITSKLKEQKKIENFLFSSNKMNRLKDNLTWYRKKKKWTQDQMGAIFNLKRSVIASYESGASTPGIYLMSDICKDLHVYLHEFISEDMATHNDEPQYMVAEEQQKLLSKKELEIEQLRNENEQLKMVVELQKFKIEKLSDKN